ncbi:MAG: hypothetical protein JO048_14430 [Methylobacteriaceae bacterium]|nr:hypothetical protein [Methylobacteriaceae bacterium]
MTRMSLALALAGTLALAAPAVAQKSVTGGSGGSAATGGTSASTLGTGGTSTGPAGTGSSIGAGGSAAAADGKAQSRTHVNNGNGPTLNANTQAQAHDGGTFSKSHTKTQVKAGEEVSSRTKTMSHEPGSAPVKSTTRTTAQ